MNKVGVVSLGCSKNAVDTEKLLWMLTSSGFEIVSDPEQAEIIIVNTCGFIVPAKEESIGTIFEMAQYKTEGSCELLIVTGCLSERYRRELAEEMPEVDMFYGVREYGRLVNELAKRCGRPAPEAACARRIMTTPPHRGYLRVGDGCDNRCTYCAIPLIRGGRSSEPMEKLLDEARWMAESGVKEIEVIAQDTTGYGTDIYGKPMITELLKALCDIDGIEWIRLLYTYPSTVTEELIDLMAESGKIVNYIDMPIQHINRELLLAMNRHGSREHIEHIIKYIRSKSEKFVIRTTAIVGFPGETEEQFEELLDFLEKNPIDRLGAFTYSPEDDTPAAEFDGQIDEAVKEERLDRLYRQQQRISRLLNERRIGDTERVIVEGMDGTTAFCRSYAETADIDGSIIVGEVSVSTKVGDFINVRLTGADEYDIYGEQI